MAFGLVAVNHVADGGVYYTPDFTLTGDIFWTKLTTTGLSNLIIQAMQVDPFNPLNRQYVLTDGTGSGGSQTGDELAMRNGGNWSIIMTRDQAATLTGESGHAVGHSLISPWCDPTVEGSIYIGYTPGSATYFCYILKSLDYGANWTAITNPKDGPIYEFQVYGNNIWVALNTNTPPIYRVNYSANGGAAWVVSANYGAHNSGIQVKYPHSQLSAYTEDPDTDLVRWDYAAGAIEPRTELQNGDGLASNYFSRSGDVHWINPYTNNHERLLDGANLLYTDDGWATYNTTATGLAVFLGICTSLRNSADQDPVIFGIYSGGSNVYAMDNETDISPTLRNGIAPNNIPTGGTRIAIYGIWVGNNPVGTGVFVFSVEMEPGDNTWDDSIYSYDALGSPMGGDRSSFRDMYADGFDVYHAEDVHAATPQIHAPWPADSGEAPVSDGTKYVPTDIITQAEFDYSFYIGFHAPVTLDADAALILDLQSATGQEIGLDTQQPTYVWMGPSFAPANEPTFQPMYIEQLANVITTAPIGDGEVLTFDESLGQWVNAESEPSLSDLHEHIINEDHTVDCNGVTVNFSTAYVFRPTSTQVYLNGLRQRLGPSFYLEDGDYNGITFDTAPEDDDMLWMDYIVEYIDYLAALSDSEDIDLTDSEDVAIED